MHVFSDLGGRYGDCVYHLPIPVGYKHLGIVHLEMINILVAVKLFAGLWAKRNASDNQAVVQVLSTGKTRDPFLAACSRNVWQMAAADDIDLTYVHVLGKNNQVADLLSRGQFFHQNMVHGSKISCGFLYL